MWKNNIDEVSMTGGNIKVKVTYSDNSESFSEVHSVSSASQIEQTVLNRTNQLNDATEALSQIKLGEVVATVVIPVVTPPVVVDIKRQTFLEAKTTLQSLQTMVDLGVITDTNLEYASAKQTAQVNFDSSFITVI